jgi:hypothetical protein
MSLERVVALDEIAVVGVYAPRELRKVGGCAEVKRFGRLLGPGWLNRWAVSSTILAGSHEYLSN